MRIRVIIFLIFFTGLSACTGSVGNNFAREVLNISSVNGLQDSSRPTSSVKTSFPDGKASYSEGRLNDVEPIRAGLSRRDTASSRIRTRNFTPPHMRGKSPVRVALLLPFSAQSENVRNVANAMFNSAQLALFDAADSRLMIIPKDTGGTSEGAIRAVRGAVGDGAEIILGPLLANSVQAVSEQARQAGVPVLAFSSELGVAKRGVYLMSFPPEIEVKRITDFAARQGFQSFAVMAPRSDYGRKVTSVFAEEVFVRGGTIARQEYYDRDPQEMFPPARRLADYEMRHENLLAARQELEGLIETQKLEAEQEFTELDQLLNFSSDSNIDPETERLPTVEEQLLQSLETLDTLGGVEFDVVLLPEQGNLLRALAPLMPYFGVDPKRIKFMGTSLWSNPDLLREPALNGGWFAAPDPGLRSNFTLRYSSVYGQAPPRIASLAYDAVSLSAHLGRRSSRGKFSIRDLTSQDGFIGVDGLYRFSADGRIDRALAIIEISPNGFKVVDPAPRSFQDVNF